MFYWLLIDAVSFDVMLTMLLMLLMLIDVIVLVCYLMLIDVNVNDVIDVS